MTAIPETAAPVFASHHAMVSVRNIDASIAFYGLLGFRPVLRWTSKTSHLELVHLALGTTFLELFAYASNAKTGRLELPVGNDLDRVGVRHFGLHVDDLHAAREYLVAEGCQVSERRTGRTMIDFFYVRDPDGNWVEIVHDARALEPQNVLHILERE